MLNIRLLGILASFFVFPAQSFAQGEPCMQQFLQSTDATNKWKSAFAELEANFNCANQQRLASALKTMLEATKLTQACQAVYGVTSMDDPNYTEYVRQVESVYQAQLNSLARSKCF